MIITKRYYEAQVLPPSLKAIIDELAHCSLEELPVKLGENMHWERPRGDLYHWVSVLNRFDTIFEEQIKKYGLDEEFPKLQLIESRDEVVLVLCLQFSVLMFEHCSHTEIYASKDRVYLLINSASIEVRLSAIEMAVAIAEKYCHGGQACYACPKPVKEKMVKIARSYPPPVPANFKPKRKTNSKENGDEQPITPLGEHFSLVDLVTPKVAYPSKWRLLNFQFYKLVNQKTADSKIFDDSKSNKKIQKHKKYKSQYAGTPKTNTKTKLTDKLESAEGLTSLQLSEEAIQKLELQEIFDKASEVVPRELWFDFTFAALSACSFSRTSSNAKWLRERLTKLKCLSIAFLSADCVTRFVSTRFFEHEPYIFGFLVDLINPENENDVPTDIHFSAMKALECIADNEPWGSDIIRCMGGNVNHGVLFQIIRHIYRKTQTETVGDKEEAYVHFCNMLGHLIHYKQYNAWLTAGGILRDVMLFLSLRSSYRRVCSAMIGVLTKLLTDPTDLFDDFVQNNGFQLLISTIGYEVHFALNNPDYNGGPPKFTKVYYTITFRQANYIRNLLKLVSMLVQLEQGDRLRNLFDSPILESFDKILKNPNVFGPSITSTTLDCMGYIIHNEPTAFTILNEAKVIDTFIENYENFIFPSSDVLLSLPEAVGAVCLNIEGLKMVIDNDIIPKSFRPFYDLSAVKSISESSWTMNLGYSFDEVGRHYPSLKPIIIKEARKLVENYFSFVNDLMEGVQFYTSEKGTLYKSKDDVALKDDTESKEIESIEYSDAATFVETAILFLRGLLIDSGQWATDAMEEISFRSWAQYILLPNAPIDYTESNGFSHLTDIIKYYDEENRDYGFPVACELLMELLNEPMIQDFIHNTNTEISYFERFESNPGAGNTFLKQLNSLHALLYTFTIVYIDHHLMFHERYHQITEIFGHKNGDNQKGFKLLSDLGLLLQRSIVEEMLIGSSLSDIVFKKTVPKLEEDDTDPPLQIYSLEPPADDEKPDGTSARFKNTLQIRFFVNRFQKHISTLFSCIGRVCMHKRQEYNDSTWRRDAVSITIELGRILGSMLNVQFTDEALRSNYVLISVNVIHYCLSQTERAHKDTIYTSLGISILQEGVLKKLSDLAIENWQKLVSLDAEEVSQTLELTYIKNTPGSVVKNILSQIFLILVKLVNHEAVPSLPSAKFYYYDGFEKDPELFLVPAFLVQTRLIVLDLVKCLVGSDPETSLYLNAEHISNIPSPLVEQIIFMTKHVWMAKKEISEVSFVPLAVENVSPPIKHVDFLVSRGLSFDQAEHTFKHNYDLNDIKLGKWPECSQIEVEDAVWVEISKDLSTNEVDFRFEASFPNKGSDLKLLRQNQLPKFAKCWFNVSEKFPKVIESVADMLLSVFQEYTELTTSLFDCIMQEVERGNKSSQLVGSLVHLFSVLLKNEKVASSSIELFPKFTGFMIDQLINHSEVDAQPFFSYGLFILEQVLCYRLLPEAEETPHKNLTFSKESLPYLIDEASERKVFDGVLRLDNVKTIDTAIAITRILILYSKTESFAKEIISSNVIARLIRFIKMFVGSGKYELLQTAAVVLLRRCFETPNVLKINMAIELSTLFKGGMRSKRDLHSILKETASVVLRDPETYVDVFCQDIRLDNLDGGEIHPSKLTVFRTKPEVKENTDIEMEEVDNTKKPSSQNSQHLIDTTGIMHILLNELMKVSKQDWISDPEEEQETKTNNKMLKSDIFKNEHFVFACFLLQVITELLGSYKQPKLEFITFSKKSDDSGTLKPRSTALNFMIHQLIPTKLLSKSRGAENDRRSALSSLAKSAILALVSTPVLNEENNPDPKKEDADMSFIRKFYADTLSKVLNDSNSSNFLASVRYEKLIDLFDLCGSLLSLKFRDMIGPLFNTNAVKYDQYFIARAITERQIPSQMASIVAECDCNFPDIQHLIKSSLKPLTSLGKIKSQFQEVFEENYQGDKDDEDDIVPDDIDDKDEAPDLFRNSTLGMYDIETDTEDDEVDPYGEGDSLQAILSEEDLSEDGSESDSELSQSDSPMEEDTADEISIEEDYDAEHDDDDENISNIHDDDIEVIDELNIDSSADDSIEGGENSDFYEYEYDYEEDDDDEVSEYDDEELDGWIEAFDDENDSSNETNIDPTQETDAGATGIEGLHRSRLDSTRDGLVAGSSLIESSEEFNDEISIIENGDEFENLDHDSRRRARDFASSFFDALRPAIGQPNIASLFEGLFSSSNDNGLLGGTIHISGPGSSSRFERSFGNMVQIGPRSKKDSKDLHSMYIKSTRERWLDALNMFFYKSKDKAVLQVIPAIVNRIEDESLVIYKKKKEEAEKVKKEREERIRKKEEEQQRKREEEAKERELNASNSTNETREPVMVRIGDREVDISGTDIDPEFFEALPDDMREEVFTQHVRERRANATSSGTDAREIDPDFLDALPDQIREEILQQESMARRFSAMEDEMSYGDNDNEEEEGLDIEGADNADPFIFNGANSSGRRRSGVEVSGDQQTSSKKSKKIFFTPLLERSGVAALIRLLFIPQPLHQREYIHQALEFACNNKQTRVDVMSLLIAIILDGLKSQKALEKVFAQVTMRARNNSVSKLTKQETQFPVGASPSIVGNQIIEIVNYLLERNAHVRYYLLTEHDNPFIIRRVDPQTKTKGSLSKVCKYPINFLFGLLENDSSHNEQSFTDSLARALQISTRPLVALQKASKKTNDEKQLPIPPPIIPDYNFSKVIKLFILNDCPNTTFRRTISAMQNLSTLPNAQRIFSEELSEQATKLGETIIGHLNSLTNDIINSDIEDNNNKSFTKFSTSSSDSAKLLRILTALDYMFESKEKQKESENESKTGIEISAKDTSTVDEIEELICLYRKLALGTLWDALSDCLRALEERKNLVSKSTALLPLIESLMVVCKHSKVKDVHNKDNIKYEVKKVDFTKEPLESLFFSFTDEHKKILNQMVRTNPNLMSGPFGMLVKNPRVLEFDNKRSYFDRKLHLNKNKDSKLAISVRRDQVFLDSYRALFFKSKDEFKTSTLEVAFKGESGIDAGGVTREWYQVLSRQMFNPDYALFTPVASDETTFHPNRTSYVNPEHLSFFKFIGKIIGKAIFDGSFLDCHFSRAVYKRILGKLVSLKDMETLDLEYFRSLMWMLENDITDVITEDFSVETDDYGEHKIIDLIPNGRNISVTEENKHEYVKLVVEYRLQTSVIDQMDNFLMGFHEIIPKDLVSIFDEQELELLISGLPDIDVTDWQNNTEYVNYSPSNEQIEWFWRAVKSFDNEERAKLLQFATGTSKVPLNGFKELTGSGGSNKFSIHRDFGKTDRLPSSHTCFNQIDLPAYDSYEALRGSLLLAITEGHEGFGLA